MEWPSDHACRSRSGLESWVFHSYNGVLRLGDRAFRDMLRSLHVEILPHITFPAGVGEGEVQGAWVEG